MYVGSHYHLQVERMLVLPCGNHKIRWSEVNTPLRRFYQQFLYTEDAQVYQVLLTVPDGDYLHSSLR